MTVNIFKCVQKRATIVGLNYCVEHFPVKVGNIVKYVNLDTNLLISPSYVVPCSKLFPVVVQEVSGKWIEFQPSATEIPDPTQEWTNEGDTDS